MFHGRGDKKLDSIRSLKNVFETGKERALQLYDKTGYSRQSIYAWRRKYLQKGLLTLMSSKDIPRGKIKESYKTSHSNETHDDEELKKQMKDLRLEVDI